MKPEHCWICDEPTGRAGRGEDSIYDADDNGPYCEDCREAHRDRFEGAETGSAAGGSPAV